VLGYLGPNGSGKSTTVKMLVGLMPPTHGKILLDGEDIQEDLVAYKQQVGYVPEEAHVYSYLTGAEFLRLAGRLRGVPEGPLEEKINRFLHLFGLDADYHAPLTSFSKGMRQKILLSAALLHNPRIVVLDEPVSGLDVSAALVMRTVVKTLAAERRIIFYSSHELETIEKISTRVIILRSGKVVADDSAADLRELMQLPSLEDVFAQLAVRENLDELAAGLWDTIRT
jgi:ABC-2 type transport system ATP-binding protein